tara:strand:- start:4921 stop:5217 length:297 start_codon:yes stop_codon:yes gene_type:complete
VAGIESRTLELKEIVPIYLEGLEEIYTIRLEFAHDNPNPHRRAAGIEHCNFMLELGRTAVSGTVWAATIGPIDGVATFLVVVNVDTLSVLRCDRLPAC